MSTTKSYYFDSHGVSILIDNNIERFYSRVSKIRDFNPIPSFNETRLKDFIINRIQKDIPDLQKNKTFIIAGGYLLGLTLEFLGISKANHSDIDVFQICNPDSSESDSDSDLKKFLESGTDLYNFFTIENHYEIIGQYRKDSLNIIKIVCAGKFTLDNLLETFDFNATKIGIVFSETHQNLYIHQEFFDFINTLELVYTRSGYFGEGAVTRSFARGLQKIKQYPMIKFDTVFYYQMALFQDSSWFDSNIINISSSGKDKIEVLKEFFKDSHLVKIEGNRLILNYTLDFKLNELCSLLFIDKVITEKKFFFSKSELSRLKKINDLTAEPASIHYKSQLVAYLMSFGLLNRDTSEIHLKSILKLVLHNRALFIITEIIKNFIHFEKKMEMILFLNKNPEYIGFLESFVTEISKQEIQAITSTNLLKKLRYTKIKRKSNFNFKPISELFIWNKYIKELCTEDDFNKEGKLMKHCVKGYFPSVLQGSERIFHINEHNEHSTFSIKSNKKGMYISQHKGVKNIEPLNKHKIIAKLFVNYLNSCLINKNLFKA